MTNERRSVEIAADAYEQGFRVLVQRLNQFLVEMESDEKLVAPPPVDGMTLAKARLRMWNALTTLRDVLPDLPSSPDAIQPWLVIEHPPVPMLGSPDSRLAEQFDLLRRFALESWQPVIEFVQCMAGEYRESFDELRQHFGGGTPVWDDATEARNKWVYEECKKGTVYKVIIRGTKAHSDWNPITSVPGIKAAAKAYARRHCLPNPAPRKSGRPRPK